jgi:hypothetical protein
MENKLIIFAKYDDMNHIIDIYDNNSYSVYQDDEKLLYYIKNNIKHYIKWG